MARKQTIRLLLPRLGRVGRRLGGTRSDSTDPKIAASCNVLRCNTGSAVDSHVFDLNVASNRGAADHHADGGWEIRGLLLNG